MSLGKMAGIFTCKQLLALSSEQNVDGYRKTLYDANVIIYEIKWLLLSDKNKRK